MRPTGTLAAALGATFLLAMPAEAQDPWRIGFRAGLNLASPEISGTGIDTCGKTSFSGGVLVERRLGNGLSLESGVLVVQRRWDLEYEVLFGTGDSPETAYVRMRSESVMRSLELPVLLKATFPNTERILWPGQYVNVELTLATKTGAVVVPTEAIQTGQEGPYVFVVRPDSTVESRPVVPGETLEHETVIEKGVSAGEKVVTDGHLRLVPGAKVAPKGGREGGAEGTP